MESNNIVSAPCVPDMRALFIRWKQTYSADYDAFVSFMEHSTPERDCFIASAASTSQHYSRGVFIPVCKI